MNEILEKEIAVHKAEIVKLRAERDLAIGEAKVRVQAKIDDAEKKLRAQSDKLNEQIITMKREGEAKLKSLQEQVADATGDAKAKLEKRLTEARADYKARLEELGMAWEHVKKAAA